MKKLTLNKKNVLRICGFAIMPILVLVAILIVVFGVSEPDLGHGVAGQANPNLVEENINTEELAGESDSVSMSAGGLLTITNLDVKLIANERNVANIQIKPRMSQGSLPIVSISTEDGIKIETTLGAPYEKSEKEILLYVNIHSVDEAEAWLADDVEQYLGGWNDVAIEIQSLKPLKITPIITKRSVNKYEENTG